MMKRIMIAGLWIPPLIPNLPFPFVKGGSQIGIGGNRNLAEFPVFPPGTYEAYPSAVNSYIDNHAVFRDLFLSLNSMINLELFGYTDSQDATVGKNGQCFFAGGMSLYDALGTQPFYPNDAAWIDEQIIKVAEYYRSRGVSLLTMITPGKEGAYRGYMPDAYKRVQDGNRPGQLKNCIRECLDVMALDPREYSNTNRDCVWYYKTDTHWNSAGGYAAGQTFIEALGGTPLPIEDVWVDYIEEVPGDPINLFHLPEKYCDDQIALVSGHHEDLVVMVRDANGDKNIVHTNTFGAPDKHRTAVIRDLLNTALMDLPSRYLANVDFYHWQVFGRSLLGENPPDAVIYLIVGRGLTRIPQDVGRMVPEG